MNKTFNQLRGSKIIVALIPAYGEEKTIADVILETSKYVDKIIVVDDKSKDRTAEIAQKLGATVLQHEKNMGLGGAIRTGINYAKELKPDIIVILDADGQHKPQDIPRLVKPILSGETDFVIGYRMIEKDQDMKKINVIGNKILNLIVSVFIGKRILDAQSGFRALNQASFMTLSLKGDKNYAQEMIIELCIKGKKFKEVLIETNNRIHGKSKVTSDVVDYAFKTSITMCKTYLRCKLNA